MDKKIGYIELKQNKKNHFISFRSKTDDFNTKRKAIFLDRDGVIIKDMHYIVNPKDVKLLPGAKELLSKSNELGWANIVISNQSGIDRGFLTWKDYENVTEKMIIEIGQPCLIEGIYANSNKPSEVLQKDNWRKPNPNMIIEAANKFNLNISESIIVGDRLSDLLSGYRAGIKKFVHVMTGHGINERNKIKNKLLIELQENNLYLIDDLTEFPIKKLI